jgi:hypothetical protein
VPAKSTAK